MDNCTNYDSQPWTCSSHMKPRSSLTPPKRYDSNGTAYMEKRMKAMYCREFYTTNNEATALETTIETLEQLTGQMPTLSLLPKSNWQNMWSLEAIKAMNKPKETHTALGKAIFLGDTPRSGPQVAGGSTGLAWAPHKHQLDPDEQVSA
ncbi:hypothetical protein B0O80DRAFT_110676 [Mortierella sp. GBAus27b]|nr:hypothetical protein B0O80DRAFT_110676 [Mortierella sp. GBAus27b]